MAMEVSQLEFNLKDSEEIGKAITKLKELTGYSASICADMIFSQDLAAKTLLFGNSNGSQNGHTTIQ